MIDPVEELGPGYIVVSSAVFRQTELFVPFQAIEDADPDATSVRLKVTAAEARAMGWQEPVIDAGAGDRW